MRLTRDQLRAARVLLHLHQEDLASLSEVGIATIRRFEGGKEIGPVHLAALRRAIEEAGAILISGETEEGVSRGVGVVLRIEAELPAATRGRIAERSLAKPTEPSGAVPPRGRGRPRRNGS